jgi:serine/threonine-protein kinase RsbW
MRPEPDFRQTIASRLAELQELLACFDTWARAFGMPEAAIQGVTLILDELITNSIEHGFRGAPEGRISLNARVHDSALLLRLTDNAPAFDPLTLPGPDTSLPLEQREPGGLGIHFARQLADELHYTRLASGDEPLNELRIVKRFAPPPN